MAQRKGESAKGKYVGLVPGHMEHPDYPLEVNYWRAQHVGLYPIQVRHIRRHLLIVLEPPPID